MRGRCVIGVYVDDRTEDQMSTHTCLVTATDKFMSGWGGAKGGLSKCAWACRPEHVDAVYDWVNSRDEMKHVNITRKAWRPKAAHCHIYVVDAGHRALAGTADAVEHA